MENLHARNSRVLVLGGGLTGLSAGYVLTKAGLEVDLFERDSVVGGLSRTVEKDGFRFDLGGHRFFTNDKKIDDFVRDLMGEELIFVDRKSKIYMRNRYFNYPLKPLNAMFGLGFSTTSRIVADYFIEKLRGSSGKKPHESLEDWVVSRFGRTMFNIYFKEYSEKVWGIDCSRISFDWVAQRIRGLSLATAVKNAFFKFSGKDVPSLVDRFVYPKLGIGRISDRLREEIDKRNTVHMSTGIERVNHSGRRVLSIETRDTIGTHEVEGEEFISSIPMNRLVSMMHPVPPADVLEAASRLKYRDLVVVAVMIDRERVTDQTWIYIPEKRIPFGRIHEPTNWSEKMAPPGKTILVMEYFSFVGDRIWNESDEGLTGLTVENLELLGFIRKDAVLGSLVVRAPKAYPLFEIGYREWCDKIYAYLSGFENLHIAGRNGMFRYYNMDHAIGSGIRSAEKVLSRAGGIPKVGSEEVSLAGKK
jgi:protoporphyrinogen oxidase